MVIQDAVEGSNGVDETRYHMHIYEVLSECSTATGKWATEVTVNINRVIHSRKLYQVEGSDDSSGLSRYDLLSTNSLTETILCAL